MSHVLLSSFLCQITAAGRVAYIQCQKRDDSKRLGNASAKKLGSVSHHRTQSNFEMRTEGRRA